MQEGAELGDTASSGGMAAGLAAHGTEKIAGGVGAPASGAAPAVLGSACAALRLAWPTNAGGEVKNACDEFVAPQVAAADLGGGVGRATLVTLGGGQASPRATA
ncbi:MAG: hypothetical protein U1E87_08850 [Alphaproteobacteria bacterium]